MNRLLLSLLLIVFFSCASRDDDTTSQSNNNISKPKGLFSSSFGNESALDNNQVKGSLIRVTWSDIEPSEGNYDFSIIEQFLV